MLISVALNLCRISDFTLHIKIWFVQIPENDNPIQWIWGITERVFIFLVAASYQLPPPKSYEPAYHLPPTIRTHQSINPWTQCNIHQALHIIICKRPIFHTSKLSRQEKVSLQKLQWLVGSKLHWTNNQRGEPDRNAFWRKMHCTKTWKKNVRLKTQMQTTETTVLIISRETK